jgi:hypothetical protein
MWNLPGPVAVFVLVGWSLVRSVFDRPGVSDGRQAVWAAVLLLAILSILRMAMVTVVIAEDLFVRNFLTTRRFSPGDIVDVAEDWPWAVAVVWTTLRERPFPLSGLLAANSSSMPPPRWWRRKSTEMPTQ